MIEARRVVRPLVLVGSIGGVIEGGKIAYLDSSKFADPSSTGLSPDQLQRTQWAAHQQITGSEVADIVVGSVLLLASLAAGYWAISGMRRRKA